MRVFITGATSGLGRALASLYAARGAAALGLVGRSASALESLRAGITAPCTVYSLDVRDARAVRAAAADFMERHGIPDVVIACAGVSVGTDSARADDLHVLHEIIDTNVSGVAHTIQPFMTPMREARAGTIVGIASVAGYRGLPGAGAYCASKAAVIAYLESARVELRDSGVSVVTISPGYIATPMTAGNPYAMPFMLSPEDAARRIVRLVERRRRYAIVPWQMTIVARLLRIMPNALFDRLFANAPRKARRDTQ